MVQMSTKSVLADRYGMSIVGIPRRYVADIHFSHFSLFRYCTRYIESRDSDTAMNENKCSTKSHIFLFTDISHLTLAQRHCRAVRMRLYRRSPPRPRIHQ